MVKDFSATFRRRCDHSCRIRVRLLVCQSPAVGLVIGIGPSNVELLTPSISLAQVEVDPDPRKASTIVNVSTLTSLHTPRLGCSSSLDIIEIQRTSNDLHVIQGELTSLSDDAAIEGDQGAAIIVESIAIAALLIGIEVDATQLERSFLDELYSSIELSQLVMRGRRVDEDFHAVQAHCQVRTVGGKELLAEFDANDGIPRRNDGITKGDRLLLGHFSDHPGQEEVVGLPSSRPGRKVSQLAVVAIVGHVHLWPDEENLAVEEQDSTVVQRRSMQDGHSDVADDPIRRICLEELG